MKAFSVRQPFAWAVLHAGCDVVNRTIRGVGGPWNRDGKFRGEVLIHTGKVMGPRINDGHDSALWMADRGLLTDDFPGLDNLPLGGIIGIARIVDIRMNPRTPASRWEMRRCLGIVLADARPLPFVPCVGAYGLWPVPADVLAKVEGIAV